VEGMMSRKPVIATAHGGPLEIIGSGKNGFLFKPDGYRELAELMDKLVEDEHLRERISEEAYKKAKAGYSMEASVGRLEAIISEVVGQ
jgi:glycosyltransferase involved in cell wall biosynthesis